MIRLIAIVLLWLPLAAAGQDWPASENLEINDLAGVLSPDDRAALAADIRALRADTGVELTLLTITRRADYGDFATIEDFATGLFNHWGIGDAARDDGILILVATEDREMRIELGAGYAPGYDDVAAGIIRTRFLPAFREGDIAGGIGAGTRAVIADIARRAATGQPPAEGGDAGLLVLVVLGGLGVLALAGALLGPRLQDRLRRCPKCGARGVDARKRVIEEASEEDEGLGERLLTCRHCNHVTRSSYTILPLSDSHSGSGGSFGGGSSAGGGASGSW